MFSMNSVWVFTGIGCQAPSAVFSSIEAAQSWMSRNRVSGTLKRYPIDVSVDDMELAPRSIDGGTVIYWTPINSRHHSNGQWEIGSGECRHVVAGGVVAGLAICRFCATDKNVEPPPVRTVEGDFFCRFACDAEWNCLNASFHWTLDEAFAQAEFDYPGVSGTWQKSP